MLCLLSVLTSVRVLTSERKRERELFPRKLGSKDERGDERKHPEESVCVVGRH